MTTVLAVIADTTIVTGLALLVCLALRRRSAALRHTILAASLAAVAVAPAFEATLPHWELPVLSAAAPVAAAGPALTSDVTTTSTVAPMRAVLPAEPNRSWTPVLVTVWAIGFLIVMVGLLVGLVRLVRMTRACRPMRATSEWRERAEALSVQCALARPVVVLESHERAPLLTWGVLRPRIVVPAHARTWAPDRIEIVLAHELAHIVRRDWVLQIAAEVLRGVYWFNPLIWMVCRRLRDEAEQACDDTVLRRGVDAADYAAHLLAVARHEQTTGRAWASAPAVASPSTLERRIAVILNVGRNREPLARATRVVTCVAVLTAMVPLAAATLTDRVETTPFRPSARGDVTLSAPEVVPEPVVVSVPRARLVPPPIVAAPESALAPPALPVPAPPAQQATSTLTGTMRDQTGGVMPGVLVSLTSKTSATRVSTTTDSNGAFRFRGLEPSEYDFVAQLPGFTTLRDVVSLTQAQDLQSSFLMRVGMLTETLLITCAPAAATHPATVGAGVMAYERKAVAPRLFALPGRTQDVRPTLAAQQLPVRVGGNVKAPQRLKSATPGCPGVPPGDGLAVVMEGTIGTDGLVKDIVLLKPTSPDAAGLARAALDAFRQWEYTPTLLNNVPTAVTVTATIVFRRP